MARSLRLAMAQLNATVGDLEGNGARIVHYIHEAKKLKADIVVFPELAITGYPPEDLLLKPQFIQDNLKTLQRVIAASEGILVVVGFVDSQGDIHNAAALAYDGKLVGVYHKMFLPNYGVFDENRYFKEGSRCPVFIYQGIGLGVNICEDIWYPTGPIAYQKEAGAEVVININSSPYHIGKRAWREKMLSTRASDYGVIVSYTNMVGGQDELVFDGGSMLFNEEGALLAEGKQFEEDLVVADLDLESVFRRHLHDPRWRKGDSFPLEHPREAPRITISEGPSLEFRRPPIPPRAMRPYDAVAEVYWALVLGTRDYVRKCGFRKVVIGLSGGIDSSLTCTIAADALEAGNVTGVIMPSRYSAPASREDAEAMARNLGVKTLVIPVEDAFRSYLALLGEAFAGLEPNVAEENLQARIRGNLLMALSNKFGWLVLTTGNKSEMATGYATLYGDMAGGFAVLKDVPKALVYQLARYRNSLHPGPVIPERVLERPPTAELKPDQLDSDTLPPYPVLDPILKAYVEEDKSFEQIVALGYDPETVKRVICMVDGSEYKRRQAPPGIKITPRAFGKDRRLPIVNQYKSF